MRNLDLNDLRVFVRVVDRGRFSVAARELGVPTSTVSRAVTRLEASAGARLLQRSPRSLMATSEGRALYASVHEAVASLELATQTVESKGQQPKGRLRVTSPVEIGSAFLAAVAVAFNVRFPLVELELSLTGRPVSLVDEGFDLALRVAARLSSSSLVARKLGELQQGLYASAAYLERRPAPATPEGLAQQQCLVFRPKDLAQTWALRNEGQARTIEVHARMGADDFSYLRAAAVAGGGIALLPRLLCAPDEAAGRLVRVLPRWSAKGAALYVMYPSAAHLPTRVSAFRDFVIGEFQRWTRTNG